MWLINSPIRDYWGFIHKPWKNPLFLIHKLMQNRADNIHACWNWIILVLWQFVFVWQTRPPNTRWSFRLDLQRRWWRWREFSGKVSAPVKENTEPFVSDDPVCHSVLRSNMYLLFSGGETWRLQQTRMTFLFGLMSFFSCVFFLQQQGWVLQEVGCRKCCCSGSGLPESVQYPLKKNILWNLRRESAGSLLNLR